VALEIIDSVERLRAFRPEWQSFLDRFPPETAFQTPEWLLTWWSHFGSGKLHVLVFRHDSEMAGLVPCFLHSWKGRRQLTLMGAGITDCLDPVLDPGHLSATLDALAAHLSGFGDWDVCDWQDLSADTPLQALGPAIEDMPCSYMPVPPCFETFLATRPKSLRRNVRHGAEKAAASGTLKFTVSSRADPELLTALIELHGARWEECGEPGMIAANGSAAFLRDVAAALAAERDMLRIFTLRLDGRIVAILLALRNDTTLFGYLTAFDPAFKRAGFGNELLARALRYAQEQGYRWWNFLRGDEEYKFAWGAQPIPRRRLIFQRDDLPRSCTP
jgi:CelD/BcsL family acetyltransferase involved in cellulose biosynthesis